MSAGQINEIRDTFRRAMLDWDVAVSIEVIDETSVDLAFILWGTAIESSFYLDGDQWSDGEDCPHYITNLTTAWQWIAMKLHEKLTA